MAKNEVLPGKLHVVELPEEFKITHYICEKKYKTVDDMQFHNHFEFGLCLDGQGVFFIDNKMIQFSKGNVSIIPPGTLHFAQSMDSHPSHWLFIALDVGLPSVSTSGICPNILFDKHMESAINQLVEELEKKEKGYKQIVTKLLDVLLIRARRKNFDAAELFNFDDGISTVYPAIEHIAQHYQEEIRMAELADKCNMSLTQFRRKFEQITGITPLKYLISMRLRMASILLCHTDRKVADIAYDVGYNTLSSFNRHFKESYKHIPKDYRTIYKKKEN